MPSFPRRRAACTRRIPRGALVVAGLIVVLFVTGCQDENPLASSPEASVATTSGPEGAAGDAIPGQYIVVLREAVRDHDVGVQDRFER